MCRQTRATHLEQAKQHIGGHCALVRLVQHHHLRQGDCECDTVSGCAPRQGEAKAAEQWQQQHQQQRQQQHQQRQRVAVQAASTIIQRKGRLLHCKLGNVTSTASAAAHPVSLERGVHQRLTQQHAVCSTGGQRAGSALGRRPQAQAAGPGGPVGCRCVATPVVDGAGAHRRTVMTSQ